MFTARAQYFYNNRFVTAIFPVKKVMTRSRRLLLRLEVIKNVILSLSSQSDHAQNDWSFVVYAKAKYEIFKVEMQNENKWVLNSRRSALSENVKTNARAEQL